MSDEDTIRAAVNVLMKPILDILQEDPHSWSDRPCDSCRTISAIIGRPFGCYEFARRRAAKEPGYGYQK